VQRNEQLAELARRRRSLIAALVKIDREITELREGRLQAGGERNVGDNDSGFGD